MGLISFLKEKFSKKTNNDVESYSLGMEKSRENFSNKMTSLSKKYKKVNQDYFDELEEILIESDVGVELALKTIEDVLTISKKEGLSDPEEINSLVIDTLFKGYENKGKMITDIEFKDNVPTVLLVVGVNGVGKTTTIAKLANRYVQTGKKVSLIAGDTFRAGATEQLEIWANRLGIEITKGKPESDPASVVYEGIHKALQNNDDLIIVDTAGRLQNKANLMAELSKIKRVISKEMVDINQETFLIIDATTGQNGVVQAKAFSEVTELTGVVVTKMDGTSKGGIILAIRDLLGVPVRFIGLGEKMDDLKEFDLDSYLYGLCIGK